MEKKLKKDIVQLILLVFILTIIIIFLPKVIREVKVNRCLAEQGITTSHIDYTDYRKKCYDAFK